MPSKFQSILVAVAAAGLTVASTQALAHHSAVAWNLSTRITITGVVKQAAFRNPHGHLDVTVTDEKGNSVDWGVETSSMNLLVRRGWKPSKVKAGDKITVIGHPNKVEPHEIYMREIKLSDGTFFGDPEGKDTQLD